MKRWMFLIITLLITTKIWAQGEIDTQPNTYYQTEQTLAFTMRTNGFAFDYTFGKHIDGYRKYLWVFDFSNIKHPKEKKTANMFWPNSNRIAFGKKNACFALKGGFGFQKELFSKVDKGGVAVRYYYFGGPSIALLKPIYYEISKYSTRLITTFQDGYLLQEIIGPASFLKGFNEIKISPGIFLKGGISFEYSKKAKNVRALEAGLQIEGYLLDVPIMALTKNSQVMYSIFLTYRFGRVIGRFEDAGKNLDEIFE